MRSRLVGVVLVVGVECLVVGACSEPPAVERTATSPITVATAPLPTAPAVSVTELPPTSEVEPAPTEVVPAPTETTVPVPVETTVAPPPPPPPDPLPPIAQTRDRPRSAIQPVTRTGHAGGDRLPPGDPAPYVAGQKGQVWRVDETGTATELVLDLTGRVTDFADGSERGLLGIAFSPTGGCSSTSPITPTTPTSSPWR